MPKVKIILASASPRRKQLLEDEGVEFEVRVPQTPIDEELEPDLLNNPPEAVKKLAEKKAGAIIQEILAEDFTGMAAVIGADTVVALDNEIYGKPRSISDAKHILRSLSGRTHQVHTGVSVWLVSAPTVEDVSLGFRTFVDTSSVTFKQLSDEEIDAYIKKGESFDKAGAYAIQGQGSILVQSYEGALDNIIGLPAKRLIEEFAEIFEAAR
ncbi:MAG: septum formation protein Maf [Eggerthellaceae bacterium]|nr:septum formation protein Maf [Eggerthellaceae bacterium]